MIWRDAYRTREHRIVVVVSHRARSKSPAPPRPFARPIARSTPPSRARRVRFDAHLFHRLRANATHVGVFARVVQRRIAPRVARGGSVSRPSIVHTRTFTTFTTFTDLYDRPRAPRSRARRAASDTRAAATETHVCR